MKYLPIANIFLILLLTLFCALIYFEKEKRVAFIDVNRLIDSYEGLKEARTLFEEKSTVWDMKIDSIQNLSRIKESKFRKELSIMDEEERADALIEMEAEMQNLEVRYNDYLRQKSILDTELSEGVMNRINQELPVFAKKNSFSLILGYQEDGSLLYGENSIDVTDELIFYLNENY